MILCGRSFSFQEDSKVNGRRLVLIIEDYSAIKHNQSPAVELSR